jgi:hypothetical protein
VSMEGANDPTSSNLRTRRPLSLRSA